jgi:hypothetical protein
MRRAALASIAASILSNFDYYEWKFIFPKNRDHFDKLMDKYDFYL